MNGQTRSFEGQDRWGDEQTFIGKAQDSRDGSESGTGISTQKLGTLRRVRGMRTELGANLSNDQGNRFSTVTIKQSSTCCQKCYAGFKSLW